KRLEWISLSRCRDRVGFVFQVPLWGSRLRRYGANRRDLWDQVQSCDSCVCGVSCPTLLRRGGLRDERTRGGHVYRGIRVQILTQTENGQSCPLLCRIPPQPHPSTIRSDPRGSKIVVYQHPSYRRFVPEKTMDV